MQTDRWQTDHKLEPKAPRTVIPARASAYPALKIRARFSRANLTETDITRIPTTPPPLWQYETPQYQAESSVSSLSLVAITAIENLDTQPPHSTQAPEPVGCSPKRHLMLSDIPTVSPAAVLPTHHHSMITHLAERKPDVWPAHQRRKRPTYQRSAHFNPLDDLRWWLVRPGHIESLIWTGGALLLLIATSLILYVTLLSTGTAATPAIPLAQDNTLPAPCNMSARSKVCSVVSNSLSNGLQLTIFNDGPFMTGNSIYVKGEGFHAQGPVTLQHDGNRPCEPATSQTDAHGRFTVTLQLGNISTWGPGDHHLIVNDLSGHRSIVLMFTLLARSTPAPTITPTVRPSATPTTRPYVPPVSQPVVPTKQPQLTATPPSQTPSPTVDHTQPPTPAPPTDAPTADASPSARSSWSPELNMDSVNNTALWPDLLSLSLLGYVLALALLASALLLAQRHRLRASQKKTR